jgi:hypothetical protein
VFVIGQYDHREKLIRKKENKTPHPKIIKTELLAIYRGHCHTKGN